MPNVSQPSEDDEEFFQGNRVKAKELPKETLAAWDTVRSLASPLPDVEESTNDGTPALKVNRKMFVRLHQDGENLVARCEKKERDRLIRENPDVFHVTEHYIGYPYVLVRLHKASREELMGAVGRRVASGGPEGGCGRRGWG